MKLHPLLLSSVILLQLGCSTKPSDPAVVREKAASATAEIKRDSKAIAQGIREGWTRDKTYDINSATKEELQNIRGMSPKVAESIVSHRPYAKVSDLLDRRLLSKAEYDRVELQLTVKH